MERNLQKEVPRYLFRFVSFVNKTCFNKLVSEPILLGVMLLRLSLLKEACIGRRVRQLNKNHVEMLENELAKVDPRTVHHLVGVVPEQDMKTAQ